MNIPLAHPHGSSEVSEAWPSLRTLDWAPTRRTLHMVTQMVGKTRLALAPAQPEWLHACLYLSARGLTTGAIPLGTQAATIEIDLREPSLEILLSDGRRTGLELGPTRSVAEIWATYGRALDELGIAVEIDETPQEVLDPVPFSANRTDATMRSVDTQRFHRVLTSVNAVLERFRSPFFGRSGIQFWWGSFDYCVLLFTGRHVPPPTDRGYILRYDLDAEHLNAGFWPGDDRRPQPQFFAYLVPEPPGSATAPMSPSLGAWAPDAHEWIMPYEEVRATTDPAGAVLEFLQRVYAVATERAGWDEEAFRYELPRHRDRRDPHGEPTPAASSPEVDG